MSGVAIELELYGPASAREVAVLDALRGSTAVMAGAAGRPPLLAALDSTLVARSRRTAEVVGVVDARTVPGHDGVLNVTLFFHPERARRGVAMEAYSLAVPYLLGSGARVIHHEVLACNETMLSILRRATVDELAVYREHAFAAGRYWDVHIFAMDDAGWLRMATRIRRVIPGLGGRFSALGGSGLSGRSRSLWTPEADC